VDATLDEHYLPTPTSSQPPMADSDKTPSPAGTLALAWGPEDELGVPVAVDGTWCRSGWHGGSEKAPETTTSRGGWTGQGTGDEGGRTGVEGDGRVGAVWADGEGVGEVDVQTSPVLDEQLQSVLDQDRRRWSSISAR